MKTVFVYGILQKNHSAERFGLTEEMYKGRAILPEFERQGLCCISPHPRKESIVEGDIWEVPDSIEEELYKFEAGFGYYRGNVKPMLKDSKKWVNAIAYLL